MISRERAKGRSSFESVVYALLDSVFIDIKRVLDRFKDLRDKSQVLFIQDLILI